MTDKPERCKACDGRGYFNCDCWPGDCICGWGDEECPECEGTGFIWPDYEDFHDAEREREMQEMADDDRAHAERERWDEENMT